MRLPSPHTHTHILAPSYAIAMKLRINYVKRYKEIEENLDANRYLLEEKHELRNTRVKNVKVISSDPWRLQYINIEN